jgi:arylsulfatase A-like enzyme
VAYLAALLAIAAMTVSADAAVVKPNFVVILLDDVGYGDLGSYNGAIPTPNIDALANKGMRFTDFHSNGAVCTPTRAALMTGRYPQRAGLEGALLANGPNGLKQTEITIADVLKNAGYRTGIVGKWHLGDAPQFNPTNQGFSFFYGFLTGEIDYLNHVDTEGDVDWWKNKTPLQENIYSTTAITREANGFIERNASRPFFLYVALSNGA